MSYWSEWRRAHPAYRRREAVRVAVRRARLRSTEYAHRPSRAIGPLGPLFGDLMHGTSVSFWEDELRADLRQERFLAALEGRDPGEAARAYATREQAWYRLTVPLEAVA